MYNLRGKGYIFVSCTNLCKATSKNLFSLSSFPVVYICAVARLLVAWIISGSCSWAVDIRSVGYGRLLAACVATTGNKPATL